MLKEIRRDRVNDIVVNLNQSNQYDLGWQEGIDKLVETNLKEVINPINNYDTIRFKHRDYFYQNIPICDIWYEFLFDKNGKYVNEYEPIGLTLEENSMSQREVDNSFFVLEFYRTLNGELPNRGNRKLVFTKMLNIPLGEKFFYSGKNIILFKPTFTGNTLRNTENMYIYWFEDESSVISDLYNDKTFWVTAKFYNSDNGDIYDFTNRDLKYGSERFSSEIDMYYQLKLDYNKRVYALQDINGNFVGDMDNPIKFYQRK